MAQTSNETVVLALSQGIKDQPTHRAVRALENLVRALLERIVKLENA
jgi:hypothetical protein